MSTDTLEHIKNIISVIPEKPGCYEYFDEKGTIIYVGKAKNLKRRVSSYFNKQQDNIKTRVLVKQIRDIKYFVVETEDMCYLVEVKRRSEMTDGQVLAKRDRGVKYCKLASAWCIANHHKPWKYLFIPHDFVTETTSFDAYLKNFIVEEE